MSERSSLLSAGGIIGGLFKVIGLLIVELLAAMAVYTYLNLFHLNTFGYLVRLSKSVLDLIASQLVYWFKGSADAAYATLFGELGPKSILLLLIGLVVSAIIRSIIGIFEVRRSL